MKYLLTIAWTAAVAALLAGCKPTMPEASRETCQPTTVVQLDRSIRAEFVEKCLRG